MTRFRSRSAVAVCLALLPTLALAHSGADAGAHHGFVSGLLHPWTGADHLAAMLAVGFWSALVAPRASWRGYLQTPLSFAALLLAGTLLALNGVALPAVEPMIAASLLVLGLMLSLQARLQPLLASLLVGGFALFHGAAHGGELAGASAIAGMVAGTAALHACGLALGHAARMRSLWWPRVTGLGTAALGAALLLA